jgi:hypothetical protein
MTQSKITVVTGTVLNIKKDSSNQCYSDPNDFYIQSYIENFTLVIQESYGQILLMDIHVKHKEFNSYGNTVRNIS